MNNLKAFWYKLPEKQKVMVTLAILFILYGIAGTMDYKNLMGV
jgi:hypothetical protein